MLNAYPHRTTRPDSQEHLIRIEGAGASDPTKLLGAGVTVTRTGAGAYRITWSENPGTYVGARIQLAAATPGDLAGHTVIADTYDSTNLRLDFVLYNNPDTGTGGQPAAHDLASSEYMDISVVFSTSAVGGA